MPASARKRPSAYPTSTISARLSASSVSSDLEPWWYINACLRGGGFYYEGLSELKGVLFQQKTVRETSEKFHSQHKKALQFRSLNSIYLRDEDDDDDDDAPTPRDDDDDDDDAPPPPTTTTTRTTTTKNAAPLFFFPKQEQSQGGEFVVFFVFFIFEQRSFLSSSCQEAVVLLLKSVDFVRFRRGQ